MMNEPTISRAELVGEARRLLDSLGEGDMLPTAYDTAWVARVRKPASAGEPLFPGALDWLLRNQNPDGSWGSQIPLAHDRVMSTLAALLALATSDHRREESAPAARRAIVYLNRERLDLRADPAETVGFELLLPELMRQAQALGISLPYDDWSFVEAIKADKLKRIPPIAVYGGPTPLAHSLEYLGEHLVGTLAPRARSRNGSYGCSPSATAYVQMGHPDDATLRYLIRVSGIDGGRGFTYLHPFENFETAWILEALEPLFPDLPMVGSLLDRLRDAWTPMGMAWSREGEVPDADDTAVSLSLFTTYRDALGTDIFELYETPDYFQTLVYERNPSVTANAHVLNALKRYPSNADRRRMILKIVRYLESAQVDGAYWNDKWHASAFYATDRAMLALAGVSERAVRPAVEWILDQQHENGAWGYQGGTQEETAWAIHALTAASDRDAAVKALADDAISRGATYLSAGFKDTDYPALWIGKGLYATPKVTRAVVVGALARARGRRL